MTANHLIDRYVHAVGRLLAGKERADIQMELRSTLQDMLEERGLEADNPQHQEGIAELLKEFGRPDEIANSYRPQRYLIGPRYFLIYQQVAKIVSAAVIGGLTLAALIGGIEGQGIGAQLGHLFGSYISALLQGLGVVTLIFFALERSGVADEEIEAELNKAWDPRELPVIEDRDRIEYFDLILDVLFTTAFLIVLNSIFGVISPASDYVNRWDWLADAVAVVRPFILWIVAFVIAELALKLIVLLHGRWRRWSRWLELAITLGNGIILALIFATAPFSEIAWLDITIRIGLTAGLLISVGVGLAQLYRLVWPQRKLPWESLGAQ